MPTRTLNVAITGDTRSLNRALSGSESKLGKFGKVAGVAGAAAGGALVLGLKKAVTSAADFEQQLDRLGAVSDASAKQMQTLKKQALDAGAATKFSALEAAQAQTELAKGGLALKDILDGGLDAALGLAAAGEMELAEAAETAVNAMKLFKIDGRDATHVADALAKAANSTTADVSDFALALKQGGSAAKAAGYDLDQTVVALELLAENGIKGSDAGTSLKAMLAQLAAPTEKQLGLMDQLNIRFFDSRGNMKSVADISAMLRDRMKGMTKEQELQTVKMLAGTDGMRAMLAMYGAGPEKIRKLGAELREQGTAADVAAKKQDNLKGKWENFMGSVETLSIQVGSKLIPVLTDATEWATKFLNSLQSGAGAGGRVTRAFKQVADAGQRIAAAFRGGNEDATRFASSVRVRIEMAIGFFRDLGRSISRTFAGSGDDFRTIGRAVLRMARVFSEAVNDVARRFLPHLKTAIQGIATVVRGVVRIVAGILRGDWSKVWDGAKDIVRGSLRALRGVIGGVAATLGRAMNSLAEKLINALVSGLKGLAGAVKNAVVAGIKGGLDQAGKVLPGIGLGADLLKKIAGDAGAGIVGSLPGGGLGATSIGSGFGLQSEARAGLSFIQRTFGGVRMTSGHRSPSENAAVGGASNSDHLTGLAVDLVPAEGWTAAGTARLDRIANWARRSPAIRWIGWRGVKGHGPGDHLHLSFMDRVKGDVTARTAGATRGGGLGRFISTAYGPPWGGINGSGVTATGVDLKSAPHRYGVAVDPSVVPLGTRMRVWPNPFGWRGYFEAFDTGGAIKGNRIDFYDWRGRSAQMNWGTRSVTVSTADGGGGGGGGGVRSGSGASARSRFAASQRATSNRSRARTERARNSGPFSPVRWGPQFGRPAPVPWWEQDVPSSDAAAGGGENPDQALIDALAEAARQTAEHTAALRGVEGELKRQTDLAQSTIATDSFQKSKWIADVISGQIGRGVINRGMTAGSSVEYTF